MNPSRWEVLCARVRVAWGILTGRYGDPGGSVSAFLTRATVQALGDQERELERLKAENARLTEELTREQLERARDHADKWRVPYR